MAGKLCPTCGQRTFFATPTGRKCSKCGAEMKRPLTPGRGKECSNCGKMALINNKCTKCGATLKPGKI